MVGKLNLFLRLKPYMSVAVDTSYYRLNNTTEIQLLVPPNNREPYYFTEIFTEDNETIIRKLSKYCVCLFFCFCRSIETRICQLFS